MELVEDHQADALERCVGLQHAGQHALGDDRQPRIPGHPGLESAAVANGLADRLAAQRGHARGHRAGREPPWLEHDDAEVPEPGRIEQRERDNSTFAGAGWRLQDRRSCMAERRQQRRQLRRDRQ